jgi:ArsR family transcriptional regulator
MKVNIVMAQDFEQPAVFFKALAHPARLQILDMLRQGELCVCHIEAALGKRQAYISQQLMALRDAGLVESRKDGLQVFYRLADPLVREVLAAVLGEAAGDEHTPIPGCRCPHCQDVVPIKQE